jgi:hypothetical protein
MQVKNKNYYIHKNNDKTYSIWTMDDLIKMSTDVSTFEEAQKLLAILPNSIIINNGKER